MLYVSPAASLTSRTRKTQVHATLHFRKTYKLYLSNAHTHMVRRNFIEQGISAKSRARVVYSHSRMWNNVSDDVYINANEKCHLIIIS